MSLNDVYTELIMEHCKSKHNERELKDFTVSNRGHNPSCGDDITLNIKLNGDIIEDATFTGVGCAISKASTSMMIDLIKGKSKEEALSLVDKFIGMIKRDITDEEELEILEDAIVLKNVSNLPARVKCAVLAWHTLRESI
ncbi:Fe-S cluster assembly sulfur transfer protein SufU [Romboutsia sp.]|uniref:Fe-S cluster assembly sulfur transfer protein SufU n=1 Tax=Romboutsia sp. TaxID=1965302 RepID=UPI003F3B56FC